MMTQTHGLVAAALLTSPNRSKRHNFAVLLGSLMPDIAIFGLYAWSKIEKIPESILWRDVYFSEPMLTITAIGNSLPLYLFVLFVAMGVGAVRSKKACLTVDVGLGQTHFSWLVTRSAIALFALAAITHLVGDFPVHAADAHPHFWPFSDWRFHSPISYWDSNHYGHVFFYVEAILGVMLSIILFRRFKVASVRALIGLLMCAYVAVPLYFSLAL